MNGGDRDLGKPNKLYLEESVLRRYPHTVKIKAHKTEKSQSGILILTITEFWYFYRSGTEKIKI